MTTRNLTENDIRRTVRHLYDVVEFAEYEVLEYSEDTVAVRAVITVSREEWNEAYAVALSDE